MSHSFYVHDVGNLNYAEVIQAMDVDNLVFAEAELIGTPDDWPSGYMHFYIDDLSCRGVEVSFENGTFQVRIMSASSPDDYGLALKIITTVAGMKSKKIEPEDGPVMALADFEEAYGEAWARQHSSDTLGMVVGLYSRENSPITLSGARRNLNAGPHFFAPLLADPESLTDNFFKRFRRLQYIDKEDVFVASVITMNSKEAPEMIAKTAVLGEGVPTVISTEADLVSVRCNNEEYIHVTLNDLIGAIVGEVEWLSDDLFLTKPYSGPEFGALIKKIEPLAGRIEDHFRPAEPGEITDEDDSPFDEEEWDLLARAPLYVFLFVAAADGKIDAQEAESFVNVLSSIYERTNDLFRKIIFRIIPNLEPLIQEVISEETDMVEAFQTINDLADRKMSPGEAREFKEGLFFIGQKVAEKPSGLLRKKLKIGETEKKALAAIAVIFELMDQ